MRLSAGAALSAVMLCGCLALSARQAQDAAARPRLPLLPAFDVSQHEPQFQAVVRNDTAGRIDIYGLYTHSSVILDGKAYPYAYSHTIFAGNPDLAPGRQWAYTVDLSEYLPGWERLDYDKGQEAWRWQSPLTTGVHALTLDMGGRLYGPVEFAWDAERPFVVHSSG